MMKTRSLTTTLMAVLAGAAFLAFSAAANAQNLAPNPGFESGLSGWNLFVPKESQGKAQPLQITATDVHSGTGALAVTVADGARVGIGTKAINVKPGEKYRFAAWVKFGDNVQIKPGTPGVYFRATLLEAQDKDISDPLKHMQIGLSGKMARSPFTGKLAPTELPKQWTKLEGVIEVPAGVNIIGPSLFLEGISGTVSFDDIVIELVPPATPLSPIVQ